MSTAAPRLSEPGWFRIGRIDAAGRRSMWMRSPSDDVIELCAGREGDDAIARIERRESPALFEVLLAARFAAEWEDADGMTRERETGGPVAPDSVRAPVMPSWDLAGAEQARERRAAAAVRPGEAPYLKHGPGGLGGPGPCDADCAKCIRQWAELGRE